MVQTVLALTLALKPVMAVPVVSWSVGSVLAFAAAAATEQTSVAPRVFCVKVTS